MNSFLRAGLGALLGLTLMFGTALAIEYDDIFEMTADGASDERIVRLIVEDGRGFELSAREIEDLREAGVSEVVIDAMRDPENGRRWLDEGDYDDDYDDDDDGRAYSRGGGYSTSLDEAYAQGYSDGRTSLVFSFGYYYGPLSRYYYCDPFYYSFWWGGHSYSYWPSYYAYWYRPAYTWYYAYPYNYYTYDSYYCYTYYDPGYWVASGYTVLPGYGRTIWDDGPRWRDGGIAPLKGGRPTGMGEVLTRLRDGTYRRNPASPPAIREALASRTGEGRGGERVTSRTPTERRSARVDAPRTRKPVGGPSDSRVGRGGESRGGERARVARGSAGRSEAPRARAGGRDVSREKVVRSAPRRSERVERGERGRSEARMAPQASRREATERSFERGQGRARSAERVARREAPVREERARVIRGNREEARERARSIDRGAQRRVLPEVRESRRFSRSEARPDRGYGRSEARVERRREAPAPREMSRSRPEHVRERVERPDRAERVERPAARAERREAPPQARSHEDHGGGGGGDKAERAERGGGRGRGR